jgi:hypothetical protein
MNLFTQKKPPRDANLECTDFMVMAERELAAFFRAVTELFGPEQAEQSTDDWLHELMKIDGLPASIREWRLLTARVSARLANRVNALSLSAEFINA